MSSLVVEVCKIEKIEKHPNADRLSIATIKGWNCIVGLDQYKVGDLVVFCPPDSVIPDNIIEQYNLEYLKKGKRVRTVKLRGFISQGLVLDLPPLEKDTYWKEGANLAEYLGITKYEPPEPSFQQFKNPGSPTKKKKNLLFDKYTDIENVKNYNRVFQNGDMVIMTEKIHGTNFRVGKLERYSRTWWGKTKAFLFGKYEFVYGSHRVQISGNIRYKGFYGEDVYGKIAKKYNLAEIIPEGYILYGEIYGPGIQKNFEYGLKEIDVKFFDVKYEGRYLNYLEFVQFCRDRNLPIVPLLYSGAFDNNILKECTEGKSSVDIKTIKEGCVVKSQIEENDPRIGRKILKSINPEYDLIKDKTEHH